MKPIDVVLDTSVLIAGLRSRNGASFQLLRLVANNAWQFHMSTALMLEYEAVARREARQLWARPERVEAVLNFLCANCHEHAVSFRWRPFLSDPNDDFILELAVAARVSYIVTHNLRDFTGAADFGVEAITPAQMLLKIKTAK